MKPVVLGGEDGWGDYKGQYNVLLLDEFRV